MTVPSEFRTVVPVRYTDFDPTGRVSPARFLTYCEENRARFLEEVDSAAQSDRMHPSFVVAEARCLYLEPVLPAATEVVVACRVTSIGSSSVHLRYEILSDGIVATQVECVLVGTDSAGRPRPIAASERANLARYLET